MKKHICFVGASTVEGLGDSTGQGWVGRLAAKYRGTPAEFVPFNLGVRGNTAGMMAERAAAECKARFFRKDRSAIVLSASINDTAYLNGQGPRTPQRTMVRHFEENIDELSGIADLIVIGAGPILEHRLPMAFYGYDFAFKNEAIKEAETLFAEACAERSIPFLATFDALAGNSAYQAALDAIDGVHPSGDGYQIMADQIANWDGWQRLVG